jgi:hypothetical protein
MGTGSVILPFGAGEAQEKKYADNPRKPNKSNIIDFFIISQFSCSSLKINRVFIHIIRIDILKCPA